MKKKVLAVLCVATFLLSLMPATAFAGTQLGSPAGTAFVNFTDGSWTSTTGDTMPDGWKATDVTVTGPGQYSVALDFTGTEAGSVEGINFMALYLVNGEIDFPGYFLEINEIRINGEAVDLTGTNYTSSDDQKDTRSNIYNVWVSDLPEDARRVDGDLSASSPVIVDSALFTGVESIEIDFTVYDADGNDGAAEEVAEEAEAEDTAAEETATTDVPKTGVVGLGVVYGLGALATGVVALKRKNR